MHMITKFKAGDHKEWLALRHEYLGGSDAAAACGQNPYESPYSLWAKKTNKMPEFEGNLITEVGSYLEDFVAKYFTKMSDLKVQKSNYTWFNDKYPWACANIDRFIVGGGAGLEIKTTNSYENAAKFRKSEIPATWFFQCVHYMMVTEKNTWYLAALSGSRNFYIFCITLDEKLEQPEWCNSFVRITESDIADLAEMEKDFWSHVEDNTEPPVDGSDATSDAINAVYPDSDGSDIDLGFISGNLIQLSAFKEQIKELTRLKNLQEQNIKTFMKTAEKGHHAGYTVTYKVQSRTSFDYKALLKDFPDMGFDKYMKTTESRVLRVNKKGEQ